MTDDRAALRGLLASGAPLTWVCTGDSITHGLIHTRGARNYVDHLHELIRGDLGRIQDTVINTAITGWRADLILDDFERRVTRWQPDVVTLLIGTNDCTTQWLDPVIEVPAFAQSITEFVRRVRALGAVPVLQTPPPADLAHAPDRARLGEFAQAVRDVAARDDAVLIDQHAAFSAFSAGTGPGNEGVPWGLLDDAFHPSAAGHALLALNLAEGLGLGLAEDSGLAEGPGPAARLDPDADSGLDEDLSPHAPRTPDRGLATAPRLAAGPGLGVGDEADVPDSRVLTDLRARVAVARHPQWPPV
ncbi:SGNH/GDSL hydrolase family protein [Microbacterium sp. p3-SID336]|uniref:SGNH/GDSL hydrolase family protein n=1 Tax=Microbacterium sp. p3-SID336 TaxID=2916212 RepID=UPI0021A5AC8A|nr:SGNH/GDSL hydrolase family protein [Microbacterium sp. p3-SID336]MCT1477436.1 SGNH/GDSL hydrolase family protein [Microbacterium sp. p3-SID336]